MFGIAHCCAFAAPMPAFLARHGPGTDPAAQREALNFGAMPLTIAATDCLAPCALAPCALAPSAQVRSHRRLGTP